MLRASPPVADDRPRWAFLPQTRSEIDAIRWGGVILPAAAPNVGREIALDMGLPHSVEAFTVTRACATGLQAVTLAAAAIERGDADVVIAGGADSTSNASLQLPQSFVHKVAPVAMSSGMTPGMNEKAVMSTARKRTRVASTAASAIVRPPSRSTLANSTMRIAVFVEMPMSSTTPICV